MTFTANPPKSNTGIIEDAQKNFPDLDFYAIKKANLVIRALNHDLRKKIIEIIYKKKKISVTELYKILRLEQSVVSQHLAILRRAGILSGQRKGKYIFYSLNPLRIEEINAFAKKISL